MQKRIGLVLLVAAGCQTDTGVEQPSTLAELGPVRLDITINPDSMWLYVRSEPHADGRCPVLGDDFTARIGDVQEAPFPGGVTDTCVSPETSSPCIHTGLSCDSPYIGFHDLPRVPNAVLVFGDASRTIECKLGDAFVTRSLIRVPDGSWDVSRGETVTVQWSPGGDLAHLDVNVMFVEWKRNLIPVSYQANGNRLTFTVPSTIQPGYQAFQIMLSGSVPTMLKGCTAPNQRTYGYSVEQYVHVL